MLCARYLLKRKYAIIFKEDETEINMLPTSVLFFTIISTYNCFNIDSNFPIVYEDPLKHTYPNSDQSSYFGYSVVLYPGNRINRPWIWVGAPRGRKDPTKNVTSGLCFKCGIGESCSVFDVAGLSKYSGRIEKIDNAWIGGSMDINYDSERIVVCAPRWIKIKFAKEREDDYRMHGACYWFHVDGNSTEKLIPLLETDSSKTDIWTGKTGSVYYFGQGQAGFSIHMASKDKEMVLGAPGVYNWDGTTILYKDNNETTPQASRYESSTRKRNRRYADGYEFSVKNIANAIKTTQTIAYDLLGYSTTSGYFYGESKLYYASSAPRSEYYGQVLIYKFNENDQPLDVKETKKGVQFGEYFGGSLTAGDINGDNLDDLIVGAPYHSATKYNEGKIYIFMGSKSGRLQTPKRDTVVGESLNGQFGTTVQYLGDINHDGFGDIAVAAPYEGEKSGVVYLFKGTSDGLDTTFCQRIAGKDIYSGIRGFGFSISRATDMDFNNYPDLAIGAYASGHVVLLRTRPVVAIFQRLRSWSSHLEFNAKRFEMEACYRYKLDQLDAGNITVERELIIDQELSRAFLANGQQYTKSIVLKPKEEVCENFTVNIRESFLNHYDPVTVLLSHKFLTKSEKRKVLVVGSNVEGVDMFCPRCPVYDKYNSVSLSTVEVPFVLGCKSGNICKASLAIEPKIDIQEDNTFVLGSKDYVTLSTSVENTGEKAYLTQLLVTVPEIVSFRSTPSACTEKNASSYLCSVGNPLESNTRRTVILELDMTTVNIGKYDESLVFTFEVLTSSENDKDSVKHLTVKLKREADVMITGESEKQSYSYRNITQVNITQIYQVEKFGSSPLNEIVIEINIPHALKRDNATDINFVNLFPPVASLAGQAITCNSNYTYLIEDKGISGHIDPDDFEDGNFTTGGQELKRSVRQVEVFRESPLVKERITKENDFDAFQNRTFYVNCSMEQFICSKVICVAGPITTAQLAKIKLKIMFDVSVLKDLLGKKDVFLFATQGRVTVTNPKHFIQNGDKPDRVDAISLLVGDSETEKVELWIIIISAVAGLLLLLLLVLGLIKAGFFKRSTKEELEQLKKEIELNKGEESDTEIQ